jgi:hypothetical protein
MATQKEIPAALRIRVTSGENAGMWLWPMSVSKGGLPMRVTNWPGVLQNPKQYSFAAQFQPDKSAAFRPFSREIADGYLRVLKTLGIDAEIVEN